ncbi:hypothetical protein SpCBS45565_g01428 [Spizellomyces sp. 'palustris']|nr:hypothetical protein SpCBS45565_g01428 [Spizellomyces sp. 'palustris']
MLTADSFYMQRSGSSLGGMSVYEAIGIGLLESSLFGFSTTVRNSPQTHSNPNSKRQRMKTAVGKIFGWKPQDNDRRDQDADRAEPIADEDELPAYDLADIPPPPYSEPETSPWGDPRAEKIAGHGGTQRWRNLMTRVRAICR